MKRLLFILFFISINYLSFAQIDKNKLIGDWLKFSTKTLNGKDTIGKFGVSNDFLRISFTKNMIKFQRTPYDKPGYINYTFDKDTIVTELHNSLYNRLNFPETYYLIEKLDDNNLILSTTYGKSSIRYYLKSQRGFLPIRKDSIVQFDNDTILLIKFPYGSNSGQSFYSNVTNSEILFTIRPYYKGEQEFGDYISRHFKFKYDLLKKGFSKPIKVSFYIDNRGNISNIQILESLNKYYDMQIVKLISKTEKDWVPIKYGNPQYYSKMLFTFILLDKR